MYVRVSLLVVLATASIAKPTGSAKEQFQQLRAKLRESHRANDWRANLVTAKEQRTLLHDAPDSLLEAARANVHLGNLDAAFRELEEFVSMGQSTDLLTSAPDFAVIRKDPRFLRVERGMEANRASISLATTAFLLPESGLLAEDIDYDPQTRHFFITSVREKKIISVDATGASADFAAAPDHWPLLAAKVDPDRRLLWATEVAIQGFTLAPESDWGRSALLCFDLTSGSLLKRIEGPRGTALGDMLLTAKGDVIVTDGAGGGVYRLPMKGNALERLDRGDFISPQTPAMHPDGAHIFVPDYARGIGLLEIATHRVRWLSMRGQFALSGIDGLYFNRGRLLAVQNGTSPERVVVFTLDAALLRIESQTIIESSTGTLGDPTHGVIVDNEFWYIANSGWDSLDNHGNLKPEARLSNPRIMVFRGRN